MNLLVCCYTSFVLHFFGLFWVNNNFRETRQYLLPPKAIDARDAHKVLPKKPRKPSLTALWRPDGPIQSRAAQEPLGKFGFGPRLDPEPDVH